MLYIGIDPGTSGAMSVICEIGGSVSVEFIKNDATERDLSDWLMDLNSANGYAVIEKVNAMPGLPGKNGGPRRRMGATGAFTFGRSYGFLRGLLIASKISFDEVLPAKWQGFLGCRTGGDKRVSKAKAQQLFPRVKVTNYNADSLLLAEYARRTRTIATREGE